MPSLIADRAALRRTDKAWLVEARESERVRVLPVWRSRNLVDGTRPPRPVVLDGPPARRCLQLGSGPPIFLGLDTNGAPIFAIDLPGDESAPELPGRFADLRMAGVVMPREDFTPLAYARGMCRWHRTTPYCARCGETLRSVQGGFARICKACGHKVFPRTDPAVMVLITRGNTCLLARQPRWPTGMFSALAGFLEPGESFEECVARETFEEVGLRVSALHYIASQPWPFPASLMVGFRCVSEHGSIRLDDDELEEARWVSREALRRPEGFSYPPPMSLAHQLIQDFLQEG